MSQVPKKIQDIDPFTYEMPFEEGIAASTIRATLCTLPRNEAMKLISEIITPKFTVLFPADKGKLRPSPDVGVHIKQDKLALVIESVSEYSSIFLEEGLDDSDIEDESVKNALRKIMDMLNDIDGESIAKNCSRQFIRFLLDCYMALI